MIDHTLQNLSCLSTGPFGLPQTGPCWILVTNRSGLSTLSLNIDQKEIFTTDVILDSELENVTILNTEEAMQIIHEQKPNIKLLNGITAEISYSDLENVLTTTNSKQDSLQSTGESTGLLSKSAFLTDEHLKELLQFEFTAAMSLDVTGMKIANNQFGEEIVNIFLSLLGSTLKSCFGDNSCARWGGDEIVVVFGADTKEELEHNLQLFSLKFKEMRESFFDSIPHMNVEPKNIEYAQREFTLRWIIDNILNEFKKTLNHKIQYNDKEFFVAFDQYITLHSIRLLDTSNSTKKLVDEYIQKIEVEKIPTDEFNIKFANSYGNLPATIPTSSRLYFLAVMRLNHLFSQYSSHGCLDIVSSTKIFKNLNSKDKLTEILELQDIEIQSNKSSGLYGVKIPESLEEIELEVNCPIHSNEIHSIENTDPLSDNIAELHSDPLLKKILQICSDLTNALDLSMSNATMRKEYLPNVSNKLQYIKKDKIPLIFIVDQTNFGVKNKIESSKYADFHLSNKLHNLINLPGEINTFRIFGGTLLVLIWPSEVTEEILLERDFESELTNAINSMVQSSYSGSLERYEVLELTKRTALESEKFSKQNTIQDTIITCFKLSIEELMQDKDTLSLGELISYADKLVTNSEFLNLERAVAISDRG